MADADRRPEVTETPKKRLKRGRKWEIEREQRISSHVSGPPCNCARLHCFENTTEEERRSLIDHLNGLKSKNEQDSLLSGMIEINAVRRRRPRQQENEAHLHDFSYSYVIKIPRETRAEPVTVCFNAFLSIFGVTKGRVERIRTSMAKKGVPPVDMRGKHNNRPRAFTDDQVLRIVDHIRSFRGRQSHYALQETRRLYLPEELNVSKMHEMFCELHPHQNCCYESYRKIFMEKFNISFGYPRKDTCSTCDSLQMRLNSQTASAEELVKVNQERELHLRKGKVFYERKTAARQAAQVDNSVAAIAFDFAKNLSCPNVTTNDVYYRRQLSLYTFNIHSLADDSVTLYCYDETVGKKGADEVCSMLRHYFFEIVPAHVTRLELFCDGCAGQNKNWTVIRFLQHTIHHDKRFDEIKLSFPIRGHSYMECDRDMAVVNQKARIETPEGWISEFEGARKNPSPFRVIKVNREMLLGVSQHLKVHYRASCQFPTRPIREIVFSRRHPRMVSFRNCWHGPLQTSVVAKAVSKKGAATQQLLPLQPVNNQPLPVSEAKFKDLQVLKRFCSDSSQRFFSNLPHLGVAAEDSDHSELSSEGEDD